LHQHEFEALKILKNGTLQQLELNKEELIGKSISESHIREKNGYGRGYRTKRERLLNPESDLIQRKIFYGWWVIKRMNKFFKD
jgi:CPA2 family monovalent cation:H+ antiporter-2